MRKPPLAIALVLLGALVLACTAHAGITPRPVDAQDYTDGAAGDTFEIPCQITVPGSTQESLTREFVGRQSIPAPVAGQPFYVRIQMGLVADTCDGTVLVHPELALPGGVSFAITPQTPVECFSWPAGATAWTQITSGCPQSPAKASDYLAGAYAFDPSGGGFWKLTGKGSSFEVLVPLVAAAPTATSMYAAVQAVHTNKDGVWVWSPFDQVSVALDVGPAPPIGVTYPSPSASAVTQTSATLTGIVTTSSTSGTVYLDFGQTTAYGTSVTEGVTAATVGAYDAVEKAGAGGSGIPALAASTTYHWRLRYLTAGGTYAGADQTFTTPPETTITSSPQSPTLLRKFSFSFSASEPGAGFECSFAGPSVPGGWRACASPATYSVNGSGTFRLSVRANGAGGYDPTPATASVVVSKPPPSAGILGEVYRSQSGTPLVIYATAAGRLFAISDGLPQPVWELPTAAGSFAGGSVFTGLDGFPLVVYSATNGDARAYSLGSGKDVVAYSGESLGQSLFGYTAEGMNHLLFRSTLDSELRDSVSGPAASWWITANISGGLGAPRSGTQPFAYVTPDGVTRVVYVSGGHIWEIRHQCNPLTCRWIATDLSAAAALSPAQNLPVFAYVTPWDNTARIVYLGTDGHVLEASLAPGGSWHGGDLTPSSIVVTGSGCIVCLSTRPPGPAATAYVSTDWFNVCGFAGCTRSSTPVAHVFVRTADNHVHELRLVPGGTWRQADLTQSAGVPPALDTPIGIWNSAIGNRVVYDGANGAVIQLQNNGSAGAGWLVRDLTQ